MFYYFDESGSWKELKDKYLVLGGIHIANRKTINDIEVDFKFLKEDLGLDFLHGGEMRDDAKRQVYGLIAKYLVKGKIKGLFRLYNPRKLSRTTKSSEDVYIENASDIAAVLSVGDDNIHINYDMNFYHAYANNIVEKMEQYPKGMKTVYENLIIKDNSFQKYKNIILSDLMKKTVRKTPAVNSLIKKLQDDKETKKVKLLITHYLLTKARLLWEGEAKSRVNFESAIKDALNRIYKSMGLDKINFSVKIDYFNKNQENAGVEFTDLICNLIYARGKRAREDDSEVIKTIYENIKIEDFR